MNKTFRRAGLALIGFSLVLSIGLAINNNNQPPISVHAVAPTVTIAPANAGWSSTGGAQSGTPYNGITVSTSNGALSTQLRSYSGSTFTVSSSVGNMTRIVYTTSSGDFASADTGSISSKTWTGDASIVNFSCSGGQVRITGLTVTLTESVDPGKEIINKTIVGPTDMEMIVGEEDVDISNQITIDSVVDDSCVVTSSAPSVVSVSGKTLHAVKNGSAVITISKEDVETNTTITRYTSAQFTVTTSYPPIDLPDMPNGDYEKVTSGTNLVDGYYLLVNEENNKIFDGSLGSLDSQSGFGVTINDNSIETSETIDAKSLYISSMEGDNQFSIVANVKEESPVYIGRGTNSNGLDTSSTPLSNTITISEGLSTILGSGGRKLTYYNSATFRYYSASNATTVSLYKKTSTEPVVDVYSENISVSKASTTIPLGLNETITASIDAEATIRDITWESNNANVTVSEGKITVLNTAVVGSEAIITAKVKASETEDDYLTAQCAVTIGDAKLTGLSRTGYNAYYTGQKISDFEGGVITASWSAGENTAISIDDPNLSITLGGEPVTKDTILSESDDKKQIKFTYNDPNYDGVSASTSNATISVGQYFELENLVPHFVDDLSYILSTSDEGNSYLSFNYTSWGGKASATVESSNSDLLVASVSEHSISGTKGSGKIGLLSNLTGKGQAIITLRLTVDDETLSTSYIVTVRNEEPEVTPGQTSYKKIAYTSSANLVAGTYIIGANTASGYKALVNSQFTKPIGSQDITVDGNGTITTADVSDFTVTIKKNASNDIAVYNGSKYLTIGNDTGESASAVYLNLSEGENGTFRLKSSASATRALSYREGYDFRSYSTTNITNGSTSYYDLELFAAESSGATYDDATVVENFINAYMQPSVLPDDKGTGSCLGENGWYKTALAHIQSDLNDAQRLIFKNDYSAYYERMQAWAIANQETFEIDAQGIVANAQLQPSPIKTTSDNIIPYIGIVAISSFALLASITTLRVKKHKED